jgi:hypothetical protein
MSWIATPLTRKKTFKISSSHSIATHHIHIPADPKNATVAVVKDLARRIEMAIEEPDTTPMPPVEFLIMVRLIVMLVEDCKGKMGFSKYSFLNTRYYYEVSGETLTWEEAMGFINRSDRFLRMIRSMAYGPMNVPPRLIRIEQKVWDIYDDQILNNANRWNRQTFEEMGAGSKMAVLLFDWLSCMMDVGARQQEFLEYIVNPFPDWLTPLLKIQKECRTVEFDCLYNTSILEALQDAASATGPTEKFKLRKLATLIKSYERTGRDNQMAYNALVEEAQTQRDEQSSREFFYMRQMEGRLRKDAIILEEMEAEFIAIQAKCAERDVVSLMIVDRKRDELNLMRLQVRETNSQFVLMDNLCDRNRGKRSLPHTVPKNVVSLIERAGVALVASSLASIEKDYFVKKSGKKSAKKLGKVLRPQYEKLQELFEQKQCTATELERVGQQALHVFDSGLQTKITEALAREAATSDSFVQSQDELREERLEDDMVAKLERKKRRQYLPDQVYFDRVPRERPVCVAISRCVGDWNTKKILSGLLNSLPTEFEVVDCKESMGLDMEAMQAVLSKNKSIIAMVDMGLGYTSRRNFAKTYDMTMSSLVPTPASVLLEGSDENRRGWLSTSRFGVGVENLSAMRDGPLKLALERMNSVVHELESSLEVRQSASEYALRVGVPTTAHLLVLMAMFMVQSRGLNYSRLSGMPQESLWRLVCSMLCEPGTLAHKLRKGARGWATFHMQQTIASFLDHPLWPPVYAASRSEDRLLHFLALYVENWVRANRLTIAQGGPTERGILRKLVRFTVASIVVGDSVDDEDSVVSREAHGGWRKALDDALVGTMRQQQVVKKIHRMPPHRGKVDDNLYALSCYRHLDRCLISLTNPSNGESYTASVASERFPNLLRPNSRDVRLKRLMSIAPLTSADLAIRLLSMMVFSEITKAPGGRRVLTLHPREDRITKELRFVDKHSAIVESSESSVGEIFVRAYVPKFDVELTVYISDDIRIALMQNHDSTLENEMSETLEADVFNMYCMDRLTIRPSIAALGWLEGNKGGAGICAKDEFKRQTKLLPELRVGTSSAVAQTDAISRNSIYLRSALPPMQLKVRSRGGAGRLCHKELIQLGRGSSRRPKGHFSREADKYLIPRGRNPSHTGVCMILRCYTCLRSGVLRLQLYDPDRKRTVELRLTKLERVAVLGSGSDAPRYWLDALKDRLKPDFRFWDDVRLDTTICRKFAILQGRRKVTIRAKMVLGEAGALDVEILDAQNGCRFAARLSRRMLVVMLLCCGEDLGLGGDADGRVAGSAGVQEQGSINDDASIGVADDGSETKAKGATELDELDELDLPVALPMPRLTDKHRKEMEEQASLYEESVDTLEKFTKEEELREKRFQDQQVREAKKAAEEEAAAAAKNNRRGRKTGKVALDGTSSGDSVGGHESEGSSAAESPTKSPSKRRRNKKPAPELAPKPMRPEDMLRSLMPSTDFSRKMQHLLTHAQKKKVFAAYERTDLMDIMKTPGRMDKILQLVQRCVMRIDITDPSGGYYLPPPLNLPFYKGYFPQPHRATKKLDVALRTRSRLVPKALAVGFDVSIDTVSFKCFPPDRLCT